MTIPTITEPEFCVICERIIGVDCHCPSTRSSSNFYNNGTINGDSGGQALVPDDTALTSDDLPAGTRGHTSGDTKNRLRKSGQNAGTTAGTIQDQVSPSESPPPVTSWTARELLGETFTDPRWAIPGIIPEGVTLLAGAPKIGKSWVALDMHIAVSAGGKAFGCIDVEPGPSLYLALEDTGRRLQRRLRQRLGGEDPPRGLVLGIECPPMPAGLGLIEKWLARESEPRLITIDVFERMRGPLPPGQSAYTGDYAAVRQIKQLADAYGVAVVLIHHLRKVSSGDFLSEISGTLGLPGASDTIAVLKRSRGDADGMLQITGRDVEEAEYALRFDAHLGAWHLLGLAGELGVSETGRKILAWLREHPGDRPAAITIGTGLPHETVKKTAARMAAKGQLDSDHQGRYFVPRPVVETEEDE